MRCRRGPFDPKVRVDSRAVKGGSLQVPGYWSIPYSILRRVTLLGGNGGVGRQTEELALRSMPLVHCAHTVVHQLEYIRDE